MLISKIKNVTPFLQYCQILRNWVIRQNKLLEKKQRHIWFQDKKLHLINRNYSFLRSKLRFTRKMKKKLKKVGEFWWLWSTISPEQIVRFQSIFLKITANFFFFSDEKRKVKKIKFRKKIRNAKSQTKNHQSDNTAKFWRDMPDLESARRN